MTELDIVMNRWDFSLLEGQKFTKCLLVSGSVWKWS